MYHEPDHLHHNEDEDADDYISDAIHGNRLMIWVLVAFFIFLTTLITCILL